MLRGLGHWIYPVKAGDEGIGDVEAGDEGTGDVEAGV